VPFVLVRYAQALREGMEEADRAPRVPWDVAQAMRQRVAALPALAQEVLAITAVLGREVPRALLPSVAEAAEEALVGALEAACRTRLLEETEQGYRFAHDVLAEVVEGDLSGVRRRLLHRRVAVALEQQPGTAPVEALAYHFSRADETERALPYLEQAGDRARARYANVAAEGYYRELVDRLDGMGRATEAAQAREKFAAVLTTVGHYNAALELIEQAAATYHTAADVERWCGALAQIAHLFVLSQRNEEGIVRLQLLLTDLQVSGASHGVAELHAALSEIYWTTGRRGEALVAAERAAAFARRVGDPRLLATAEERRATLLATMVGRQEEALRVFAEARRAAETASDFETLYWALGEAFSIHMSRGEFDMARRYLEQARDVALRQHNPRLIADMLGDMFLIAFYQGNWDLARTRLREGEAMRREDGNAWNPFWAWYQALLGLAEGRAEVSQLLEDWMSAAERRGSWLVLQRAHYLLAVSDLLEGRARAACARLVPLLDRPGVDEQFVTRYLAALGWAYLELGKMAQAEQMVAQAIARMRTDSNRLDLVDALRVQALVAIRQGQWAEAEQALEEGLALARAMPYPYSEACLLRAYAEMHAQKGEPEPARQRLEAAMTIFQRLGARHFVAEVEQVSWLPFASTVPR
jgi:tetratricopeptide (TPR) repeat protein